MPPSTEENYFDEDDDLDDYVPNIRATNPDLSLHYGRGKTPPASPPKSTTANVNLEQEVKARKKRVVVRLDGARLLSNAGIPKLRREAPKKLVFKGKGHEYGDAGQLLAFYQFWADDLFKKGKFKDTVAIIEKLGHSKAMRVRREGWIQEEVNRKRGVEPNEDEENKGNGKRDKGKEKEKQHPGMDTNESPHEEDAELYALPSPVRKEPNPLFNAGLGDGDDEVMEIDDDSTLDALLEQDRARREALEEGKKEKEAAPASQPPEDEDEVFDFSDDEEGWRALTGTDKMSKIISPMQESKMDEAEDVEAMEALQELDLIET